LPCSYLCRLHAGDRTVQDWGLIFAVRLAAGSAVRWGLSLLLAGGMAACSGSSTSGATAPMPPRSASPARVARIYLQAAKATNCSLTAALTLNHTWSWCRDPRLLDYKSVGSALFVPASMAGRDEQCVEFEMDTHGSSDGSMPVGGQPWGLCLVKTNVGWRLYDQGQG
jgi:hypothetical protein